MINGKYNINEIDTIFNDYIIHGDMYYKHNIYSILLDMIKRKYNNLNNLVLPQTRVFFEK
jgi:hypothetical protein